MVLGLLLPFLALFGLAGYLHIYPALDADSLYIPELWARLIAGGSLGTWWLPPNTSLWPDLVLWHATHWLQEGVLERLQLYGLAMGWALLWFTARLLRALGVQGFWQSLSLSATGLILGMVLAPAGAVFVWLAPAHQGIVVVAALWLWSLVLEPEMEARDWKSWLSLMLCLGLLLSSHRLLVPIALSSAIWLSFRSGSRKGFKFGPRGRLWLAILLSLSLAEALRFWLLSTGVKVPIFPWKGFVGHLGQQLMGFNSSLPTLTKDVGLLGAVTVVGIVLWAAMAVKERGSWTWTLVAWFLSLVGALAVGLMMGSLALRYLLLPLWLPVLLLPTCFVRLWPRSASS